MPLKTSDIAAAGNPDLTGIVPFTEYMDALQHATQLVNKDTFTENERRAFDRFVEVVRGNAFAVREYGRVWMMPKSGIFDANKTWWASRFIDEIHIFQPPVQGTSSSLLIFVDGDVRLYLIAKDVSNLMSKESVVNFLKAARKKENQLAGITDDEGDFFFERESVNPFTWSEGGSLRPFPKDFIASGNIAKKLDLDPSVLPDTFFEDVETEGLPEFQSLSRQDLAVVRTFFSKLRKALKNPSESKSESSEGEVISINGNVVEIAENAGGLTELVAKGIDSYLEVNWFQLLNPLTISLGGDSADVNVEVDEGAGLRTQVRSALEQISVPLARELEYSVFGFDSDAFEVAGELMYFAGVN